MHFKCPRCARRHSFPAARMNAAGRVPCRCGVTLVLQPPSGGPRVAVSTTAEIAALGYRIVVERASGPFDGTRQAVRATLGLEPGKPGIPEPARAARPDLLWPALGVAFDPRLCLPGAAGLLAGLSARWLAGTAGALSAVAVPAIAVVGAAVGGAVATIWTAAAAHEGIAGGGRVSLRAGWAALRARRGLLMSAARDAGLGAALVALVLASVAGMAGLAGWGGTAALLSRVSAPLQAVMVLAALGLAASLAHRLLAHAAAAPQARGLLVVQVALDVRRIAGDHRFVPARALAPALAAALVLAVGLASVARLVVGVWDAVTAGFPPLPPVAHAVGRDVVFAAAGGVVCSYLGVTGLFAGYGLGTGAAREPVRAPEIITGTQQSINAQADE